MDDYRDNPALNVSHLALMAKSPRHFKDNLHKESQAMRFGTTVHMAILETEKFRSLYVVEPEVINGEPRNNRLKAHKEFIASWRADQAPDAVILTPDEMESLSGILMAIKAEVEQPLGDSISLGEILATDAREVPIFRDFLGRPCKGKADLIVNTKLGRTVVDFKKVGREGGASPGEFSRVVSNLHYDAKAYWYKELFQADAFLWVAVEEKAPHAIGIYDAEPFMEIGERKIKKWMQTLAECEKTNVWPWYTRGAEKLYPSSWQISQIQEDTW